MYMDEWRNRVVEEKHVQALLPTLHLQLNPGKDCGKVATNHVSHGRAWRSVCIDKHVLKLAN